MTETARLPKSLSAILQELEVPEAHVLDVCFEATARTPWMVSLDRQATGKPHAYANVRPKGVRYFDTMDAALDDAGGMPTQQPPTGEYFELQDITSRDNPVEFRPPITFHGQVGDLIMLTVPPHIIMSADQANGLRVAARVALSAAVKSGQIPRDARLTPFMVPEGVRMVRLVERKAEGK